MVSKIQELAKTVGFRGTPNHRVAEPSTVHTLPVVDNALPTRSNVRTSVDCYVSGQYVNSTGKIIEVNQRYSIFVSYTRETQMQTMKQIRDRITGDFQEKYGTGFNITNAFVPGLPVPKEQEIEGIGEGGVGQLEMYRGSGMFRDMTRFERARYEIGTQREIAKINIEAIKDRYGVKR